MELAAAQTIGIKVSEMNSSSDKQQSVPGKAPAAADIQRSSVNKVLDGLENLQSLNSVVFRVMLGGSIYGAASSMFIFALLQAFNLNMFGWGPAHMAAANLLFVIYFSGIMLPFSVLLSWVYRYKQALPYQERIVELAIPYLHAYELCLGAALSLPGAKLISADEKTGEIICLAPRRRNAAPQEIKIHLQKPAYEQTRITVSSRAKLGAIEYLLFGFTLAVDGGRNKENADAIVSFLNVQHN